MINLLAQDGETGALRDLIRQSEVSGAKRRAVLLHTDRLPPSLGKPHHHRLAKQALASLAKVDRAQRFELPRGRVVILWRGGAQAELAMVRLALQHLLSGQPDGQTPDLGGLMTMYDLPDQAVWLLDELAEEPEGVQRFSPTRSPMDAKLLAKLESSLAQSDLSRFVRVCPVIDLQRPDHQAWKHAPEREVWEERAFAIEEIAASLCPDRRLDGDLWLSRRLTRSLDRKMLVLLATARDICGSAPFAINLNAASILSPEFQMFDGALPVVLRGQVILNLYASDILSDTATFLFARDFARARHYRFALAGATLGLLKLLDVAVAGFDYVKLAVSQDLRKIQHAAHAYLPPATPVVVTGLDRPGDMNWARQNGFRFGQARTFNF